MKSELPVKGESVEVWLVGPLVWEGHHGLYKNLIINYRWQAINDEQMLGLVLLKRARIGITNDQQYAGRLTHLLNMILDQDIVTVCSAKMHNGRPTEFQHELKRAIVVVQPPTYIADFWVECEDFDVFPQPPKPEKPIPNPASTG